MRSVRNSSPRGLTSDGERERRDGRLQARVRSFQTKYLYLGVISVFTGFSRQVINRVEYRPNCSDRYALCVQHTLNELTEYCQHWRDRYRGCVQHEIHEEASHSIGTNKKRGHWTSVRMNPLEATDVETVLSGRTDWVGPEVMETLARHPLDAINTEFPHYVHSIESPDDTPRPAAQHPIFYGCFDWHSAVHSHGVSSGNCVCLTTIPPRPR